MSPDLSVGKLLQVTIHERDNKGGAALLHVFGFLIVYQSGIFRRLFWHHPFVYLRFLYSSQIGISFVGSDEDRFFEQVGLSTEAEVLFVPPFFVDVLRIRQLIFEEVEVGP